MQTDDLLRQVVEVLDRLRLPYFVTGSVATIYFGEPRFTNDIDIVVDLPPDRVRAFCAEFPPDQFYVSEESARRAVRQRSQFNVIHPASGLKVDVIVPPDTPFNRSRFHRARHLQTASDHQAVFTSPEDVILMKMQYFQLGGSEKHLRDIAGIFKISGSSLDRGYIEHWARRLELEEVWELIVERNPLK